MQQNNFTTQNYAVGFGKRAASAIPLILRISPAESFPKIVPLFDQIFLFPSFLLANSRIHFFFDVRYSVTKISDRASFDLHANTFLAVSADLNATNTGAGRFFALTIVSESVEFARNLNTETVAVEENSEICILSVITFNKHSEMGRPPLWPTP